MDTCSLVSRLLASRPNDASHVSSLVVSLLSQRRLSSHVTRALAAVVLRFPRLQPTAIAAFASQHVLPWRERAFLCSENISLNDFLAEMTSEEPTAERMRFLEAAVCLSLASGRHESVRAQAVVTCALRLRSLDLLEALILALDSDFLLFCPKINRFLESHISTAQPEPSEARALRFVTLFTRTFGPKTNFSSALLSALQTLLLRALDSASLCDALDCCHALLTAYPRADWSTVGRECARVTTECYLKGNLFSEHVRRKLVRNLWDLNPCLARALTRVEESPRVRDICRRRKAFKESPLLTREESKALEELSEERVEEMSKELPVRRESLEGRTEESLTKALEDFSEERVEREPKESPKSGGEPPMKRVRAEWEEIMRDFEFE